MKRKLRLGDSYALTTHKPKYHYIRYISLLAVLTSMCLYAVKQVSAQQAEPVATAVAEIKPLQIGDTIPEWLWHHPLQVVNHSPIGGRDTVTLDDYRGKLIILDFWATWCSPCIASIEKLSAIQQIYPDKVALIPIASHEAIDNQSLANFMKSKNWPVASVIDRDKFFFDGVFRHGERNGIPYVVWIKDGRVAAKPKIAYVTEENILRFYEGKPVDIEMKLGNVRAIDRSKPLFLPDNGFTKVYQRLSPYSVIGGYIPNYGTGRKMEISTQDDTVAVISINRTLEDLIFDAFSTAIMPKLDKTNGIYWYIDSGLRKRLFVDRPGYDKTNDLQHYLRRMKWLEENTYSYNLRVPDDTLQGEVLKMVRHDITMFFKKHLGVNIAVEPAMKHRYAVLKTIESPQETLALLNANDEGRRLVDTPSHYQRQHFEQVFLKEIYNRLSPLTINAVIDSTGIPSGTFVSFDLPNDTCGDDNVIVNALKRYGLSLSIRETYVPVITVRQSTQNNLEKCL
ncbi:TlpA family protein disulfide reductase [Parapedobacter sp. 2B3]|uniref:TlpA family protein disulfide reductase n=1 Tax=Parapedobacter sp. 2B3 TaxID=3342381 RepID=UPI0035B58813